MGNTRLIRVTYPEEISLLDVSQRLSRSGIKVDQIVNEDLYILLETQKKLRSEGMTKMLSPELHVHEVLTPKSPLPILVKTIRTMLEEVTPEESLTIIDPYIFPRNFDEKYVDFFFEIIKPFINTIRIINFVTKPNYSQKASKNIELRAESLNPEIEFSIKTSKKYHDRFWICDELKGLFLGTSLNGVGKKYALADFLKESDVTEIVGSLKQEKLL